MASTYLTRTPSSDSNRIKWTFSAWIKKSAPSAGSAESMILTAGVYNTNQMLQLFSQEDLTLRHYNANGTTSWTLSTDAKLRDPSAWSHIVVTFDTAQATSTNRVKMYINGSLQTISGNYPDQNQDSVINSTLAQNIGFRSGSSYYFNGLMTHIHLCDGYAYDASSFGETDSTSGIWKPKTAPSVTYGTNGFFLKFENSGAMGTDSSGNSNTFTVSGNLTQNVDTPSNNFATLNAINNFYPEATFSNGNLKITTKESAPVMGTIGASSGKYYWEVKVNALASTYGTIGIVGTQATASTQFITSNANEYMYYSQGSLNYNGGSVSSGYDTYTANDIIGIAMDLDNNRLFVSKNGTWQNSADPTSSTGAYTITAPASTSLGAYFPAVGYWDDNDSANGTYECNFGQGYFGTTAVASAGTAPSEGGIFEYNCPSGYQALCTKGINSF